MLANKEGVIKDATAFASVKLGFSPEQIKHYNCKVQSLKSDIIIDSSYRYKKQRISFSNFAGSEIEVTLLLRPVLFSLRPEQAPVGDFKEKRHLAGYSLHFDFLESQLPHASRVELSEEPDSDINPPSQSIWQYFSLGRENTRRPASKAKLEPTVPKIPERETPDNRQQQYALGVKTKKLDKGKLVDLTQKEFDSDLAYGNTQIVQMGVSQLRRISVSDVDRVKGLENFANFSHMLEKMIHNQESSPQGIKFSIISILWFISILVISGILLSISFSQKEDTWNKIFLGRQVIGIVSGIGSISTRLTQIKLQGSLEKPSSSFIQQKFKEIDSSFVILLANSTSAAMQSDQDLLDESIPYTYGNTTSLSGQKDPDQRILGKVDNGESLELKSNFTSPTRGLHEEANITLFDDPAEQTEQMKKHFYSHFEGLTNSPGSRKSRFSNIVGQIKNPKLQSHKNPSGLSSDESASEAHDQSKTESEGGKLIDQFFGGSKQFDIAFTVF
jgi:hypothetical protein